MKNLYFLLIILFCSNHTILAQYYNEGKIPCGNEKNDSLNYYLGQLSAKPSDPFLNFKTGFFCLQSNGQNEQAVKYLQKVTTSGESNISPGLRNEALFYLARANRYLYKYDQAIKQLNDLASANTNNSTFLEKIEREIALCHDAKILYLSPIGMTINSLSRLNSEYSDHSPVITADENTLIFTSRRKGSTGGKTDKYGNFFEDIYISYKKNHVWQPPQNIGNKINTGGNEYACSISRDGKQLVICRDGDIYISKTPDRETWSVPQKLGGEVNSEANETHASVSIDGRTIYFTSNRAGGYGGMDIYSATIQEDGTWGKAKNIGPKINTPYNEETPFIHPDGYTLLFSSEGHQSIGGFDVFYSIKRDDGFWAKPVNYGYPVCTSDDDLFFVPTLEGQRLYYSSCRLGSLGKEDLYIISFHNEFTIINGKILSDNGIMPQGAKIVVTDIDTREQIGVYNPDEITGSYLLNLDIDKSYNLLYKAPDHLPVSENLSVIEINADERFYRPVILQKIAGQPVIQSYELFFFDNQDTILNSEAEIMINNVAQVLTENSQLIVDVSFGSNFYRDGELFERKKAIISNALAKKGVDRSRVFADLTTDDHTGNNIELTVMDKSSKEKETSVTSIKGTIKSSDGEIITDTKILVKDIESGKIVAEYSVDPLTGEYRFPLPLDNNYTIIYQSEGFLPHYEEVSVIEVHLYNKIDKPIILNPVMLANTKQIYEMAFYDETDTVINEKADMVLNNLSNFLADNKELYIDISNIEAPEIQDILQRRTQIIKDSLIRKGVDENRIVQDLAVKTIKGKVVELTVLDEITKKEAVEEKEKAEELEMSLMNSGDNYVYSILIKTSATKLKQEAFKGLNVNELKTLQGEYLYYYGEYFDPDKAEAALENIVKSKFPHATVFINDLLNH